MNIPNEAALAEHARNEQLPHSTMYCLGSSLCGAQRSYATYYNACIQRYYVLHLKTCADRSTLSEFYVVYK